jgi:hypothetical protein
MIGHMLMVLTAFHVTLSLIGIGAGAVAIRSFLVGRKYDFWNYLFLWTTGITCITGFFFPFHGMTPGIVIGIVCLLALAVAILARCSSKLKTYIAALCFAEALNVIVLVTQSFEKVAPLHTLAPTGKETVVAVCQLLALLLFAVVAWVAIRRAKTH